MPTPQASPIDAAPRFAAASAVGEPGKAEWGKLAFECVEKLGPLAEDATLGFVYVTDALAGDLAEIVAFLKRTTAVKDWFGTVGVGIVAGSQECFDRPAIAVLAASVPREAFCAVGADAGPAQAWARRTNPVLGIIHADPRASQLVEKVEAAARDLSVFLVGGLASSRGEMDQVAGKVVQGTVSGVMLAPELGVIAGLSQGCSPIGPVRRVSEAEDNIIVEIDGRPALDVLKEDMGELLSRDLKRALAYIHAALPIPGSDTGDYMVRNLVGIDPGRGLIGIGAEICEGDPILFTRRDHDAAAADLKRMLAGLARRTGGAIKGGVYVSCIARGPNLFGEGAREIGMVTEALGPFPLVGFFANGEICRDRLYGYTGILTLFL